jgi:hypothetical protein
MLKTLMLLGLPVVSGDSLSGNRAIVLLHENQDVHMLAVSACALHCVQWVHHADVS